MIVELKIYFHIDLHSEHLFSLKVSGYGLGSVNLRHRAQRLHAADVLVGHEVQMCQHVALVEVASKCLFHLLRSLVIDRFTAIGSLLSS